MTTDDDLRTALAGLAADDVSALLAEVRAAARDLVRQRLVDIYADAMLSAVAGSTQPTTQRAPSQDVAVDLRDSTRGCYVYAVTVGVGASAATGETGILPGGPVEVLSVGDIAAVVSDVDVIAVRDGCEAADLSDDGWLANAVRAHDRVVAATFRSAPAVPVRFGVVYPDRPAVMQMLREHRDELQHELDRLSGRAEWNVKVFLDLTPEETAADSRSGNAGSSGVEYLTRERDRRAARAQVLLRARSVVADAMQALDEIAVDCIDLKHSPSSGGGAPYFAATYLVDRDEERRFTKTVERLGSGGDRSVTLTADGPWPPFHFTALRLEPNDA